jgi:hypothetical protein
VADVFSLKAEEAPLRINHGNYASHSERQRSIACLAPDLLDFGERQLGASVGAGELWFPLLSRCLTRRFTETFRADETQIDGGGSRVC